MKSLQSKLHGALAEYFKLSGLYNEAELSKLEQESSVNGVRVSELQVDMGKALDGISEFIGSQMDGSLARQMAWDAVKRKSSLVIGVPPLGTQTNLLKDQQTGVPLLGSRQITQATIVK